MKNCPHCGSPQRDEAVECRSCGRSFISPPPAKPAPPKILLVSRLWLWLSAWLVAAVVMLIDAPGSWRSAWQFPVFSPSGFVTALILHPVMGGPHWHLTVVIGWVYYALLTLAAFAVPRYRVFFWLFVILCMSLILNCLLWLLALYMVLHS